MLSIAVFQHHNPPSSEPFFSHGPQPKDLGSTALQHSCCCDLSTRNLAAETLQTSLSLLPFPGLDFPRVFLLLPEHDLAPARNAVITIRDLVPKTL